MDVTKPPASVHSCTVHLQLINFFLSTRNCLLAATFLLTPFVHRTIKELIVDRLALIEEDVFTSSSFVPEVGEVWGPHPAEPQHAVNSRVIRLLDVCLAASILLFILPLMAVVALLVVCQDGGPAVFAHERVGRGGRTFRCLKFRSMLTDADKRLRELLARDPAARREWEASHKLRDDPRITRLGAFLRRSSLDELPQFINVLRGEMSIVGPRPIVQAEVDRYGRRFAHYTAMRPGITGLWQVGGRSDTTYRRRVAFDVLYARAHSPQLYIAIVLRTVPAVLSRSGSY